MCEALAPCQRTSRNNSRPVRSYVNTVARDRLSIVMYIAGAYRLLSNLWQKNCSKRWACAAWRGTFVSSRSNHIVHHKVSVS